MGCGNSTPGVKKTSSHNSNDTSLDDFEYDNNLNQSKPITNGGTNAKPRQKPPKIVIQSPSTVGTRSSAASSAKSSLPVSRQESVRVESLDEETDSYPPKPNRLKKTEIVPDVTVFANIDQHVANTPKNATASVAELAQYLLKPCHTQLEKVRALYQWVIKNIDYDVSGYMSGNLPDCSSETTLRARCSVCSGYSKLFESLCKEAGIPVKVLNGLAKGFSHKPEEKVQIPPKTNHAWNVVFISNEWRLIDCTWDAGHIDGKTFTRHEGEFYFLVDPEVFINDHFPYENNMEDSQKWQLLDKPLDLTTYAQRVKLDKDGFRYGLELVSHKNYTFKVAKEAIITLKANGPPLKGLKASLTEINGSSEKEHALIERAKDDTHSIRVRPLKKASYDLQIYGNMGEKSYHPIVTYRVDCTEVQKNILPYPKHFGFWGFVDNFAEYGFDQGVTKLSTFVIDKGELEFEIPMQEVFKPLVTLTRVGDDDKKYNDHVMFVPNGSSLLAKMMFPHVGCYKLILFAKKLGQGDTNEVVANIFVECKKASNNTSSFPMMYDSAIQYKVNLLEPMYKELPANTKVTFRFSSPVLVRAKIKDGVKKSEIKNDIWEISETTPDSGTVTVFGSDSESGSLNGLFQFTVT